MLRFMTAAAAVLSAAAWASAAQAQTFVESDSQWDMRMIGVQAAYDRGFTGFGVIVGVVDSGINPTHRDLVANLTNISLDIYTAGPVVGDPHGHGTHVAGTIAGSRNGFGMQGVAYDARLAILRLLDANNVGSGPDNSVAVLLNYALDEGVRIFNNSWGGLWLDTSGTPQDVIDLFGAEVISAYQRAVELDAILVWATGNESLPQPGLQAGLPYYFPDWQGNWLAVTAVGSDGVLASYANRCGAAAAWCLAAPGGDAMLPGETAFDAFIWSAASDSDQGLSGLAGTSMAAPHVTGAVAIARQMFPQAPARAVTRLVLATATDLGAPGVDETYGWGLLNIGNMAVTLDAEAGSLFANGVLAAQESRKGVNAAVDARLARRGPGGAWAQLFAGRHEHDSTPSSLDSEAETAGFVAGYDRALTPRTTVGVSLHASRTRAEESAGANRSRTQGIGLSAYGAIRSERLFLEGVTGLESREHRFQRGAILGAAGTVLEGQGLTGRAETDGLALFARARLGVVLPAGPFELRPYLHAGATRQTVDAFSETGADVFSLTSGRARLTVYEAGPGIELVTPAQPLGAARVAGSVSVHYDARWGDDEFALPMQMLGSPVPAAVGELDDGVTLRGAIQAELGGGWTLEGVGWWAEAGDNGGAGLGAGVRLAF